MILKKIANTIIRSHNFVHFSIVRLISNMTHTPQIISIIESLGSPNMQSHKKTIGNMHNY